MKRLFSYLISLFIFVLPHWGCPDDDGVKPQPTNPLTLTVDDVTCTEAFLKLSLASSEANRIATLKRNDSTIATITMANSDSLFVDEGLLPNKTYTYKLIFGEWSATAQATMMDTTSHDWVWQIDTLGTSSSVLFDVAIINDTLAYAVGEIHTNETDKFDSLGNWINPYNVAKWNGKKWELMRALFKYNGQDMWSPIHSVFAFSKNDIWFEAGIHWNGQTFETMPFTIDFPSHVNKMWGSPSGDLYIVGNSGLIGKRSPNSSWQKMESGTTQHLVDADGSNKELFAVGINVSRDAGIVLKHNQEGWERIIEGVTEGTGFVPGELFKTQLYGSTDGVWVDETGTVYTVGIYMYRYKLGLWNYMKSLPGNHLGGKLGYRGYLHDIDGNDQNDMFIAGQRGTLRHFNGSTWVQVGESFNYNDVTRYWYGIAVHGNLAVVAGSLDGQARVMVLRRD